MSEPHEGINIISNVGKIINFAILFFLLYILAKSPLSKYIKNKKDSINEKIEDSFRKRDEVERRLRELEKRLKNIDSEVAEIILEGEREAIYERERILEEADREAKRIIMEAEEAIEEERKKGIDELRRYGAEILIRRVIEKIKTSFGKPEQKNIIRKAMDEIRKAL